MVKNMQSDNRPVAKKTIDIAVQTDALIKNPSIQKENTKDIQKHFENLDSKIKKLQNQMAKVFASISKISSQNQLFEGGKTLNINV